MAVRDFSKPMQTVIAPKSVSAEPSPSEQAIFSDPRYLAAWVNKHFLQDFPLERNYELVPDDDIRELLGITSAQRERCAREFSVLRIAGVSWFVQCVYSDVFWLSFSRDIVTPLARQIFGSEWNKHVDETADALVRYVSYMAQHKIDDCAQFYLTRLYNDHDQFSKIKDSGVGDIGPDEIINVFGIMEDAYIAAVPT